MTTRTVEAYQPRSQTAARFACFSCWQSPHSVGLFLRLYHDVDVRRCKRLGSAAAGRHAVWVGAARLQFIEDVEDLPKIMVDLGSRTEAAVDDFASACTLLEGGHGGKGSTHGGLAQAAKCTRPPRPVHLI